MIRRIFAIIIVVGAGAISFSLPPRARSVTPRPGIPAVVRGVMHVHTTQSDGSGSSDAVAAAARRAGLAFVILTDHGDGTRPPAPPRYASNVLLIDAVEISTDTGHVVALDLPRAPYPLRGPAADVLDDIRRLGGMSIVAHPTSGKADLRWSERGQPYDGIEWLNGDSEWRNESPLMLARILAGYWFRPPESLALLLGRPVEALALWDQVSASRPVVGLAGADAHAKIGGDIDHGGPLAVNLPSYEQSFRTFSIGLPSARLSGNAAADARVVIAAIRAGQVFTAIDAFARPGRIDVAARTLGQQVEAGGRLPAGHPVAIHVEVDAPTPAPVLTLYRNGTVVASAVGTVLEHAADAGTGVYRAEATLQTTSTARGIPWLVSNPVYIGPLLEPPVAPVPTTTAVQPLDAEWAVEHSDRATGSVQAVRALEGTQAYMRYALGGVRSAGPFVAFAVPLTGTAGHTRLRFRGRANHPMRLSVQLRTGAAQGSARWRKSVYLDQIDQRIDIAFTDFLPVETGQRTAVPLENVASLLLVVDSVNTALGTNGEIWIDDLALAR